MQNLFVVSKVVWSNWLEELSRESVTPVLVTDDINIAERFIEEQEVVEFIVDYQIDKDVKFLSKNSIQQQK